MHRRLTVLRAALLLSVCPVGLVAQDYRPPPPPLEWVVARYVRFRAALTRPALTPAVVIMGSYPWRDSSGVRARWLRSIGAELCDTGCDVSSIRSMPVLRINEIRLEPDSLGATISADYLLRGDLGVSWREEFKIRDYTPISLFFRSVPDRWGSLSQYADQPALSLLHRWLEARHQIMWRTAWIVVCGDAIPTAKLNQYVMASRSDRPAEGVVDDPECRIPLVAQSDSLR